MHQKSGELLLFRWGVRKMEYLGNKDILKLPTIGFLSSQKCSAEMILKSYDWAKEQRNKGNCVICGNHSQIEKDVFEILLKGNQPLILMLARGMKTRWRSEIEKAVKKERLLIISPFEKKIKRVTRETAEKRNEKMIEISNEIIIGYKTENGQLDNLLERKNHDRL